MSLFTKHSTTECECDRGVTVTKGIHKSNPGNCHISESFRISKKKKF